MREFIRPAVAALSIACLAASMSLISNSPALAQAKQQMAPAPAAQEPPPVKQIALTDKQIEGVLAASKDMDAITEKLPENAQPDAKVRLRSTSGRVVSEFDCLRSTHAAAARSVNGTLGAGSGQISVTTLSGRVTLLKRPEPAPPTRSDEPAKGAETKGEAR